MPGSDKPFMLPPGYAGALLPYVDKKLLKDAIMLESHDYIPYLRDEHNKQASGKRACPAPVGPGRPLKAAESSGLKTVASPAVETDTETEEDKPHGLKAEALSLSLSLCGTSYDSR
jgi:hypothetical protein